MVGGGFSVGDNSSQIILHVSLLILCTVVNPNLNYAANPLYESPDGK